MPNLKVGNVEIVPMVDFEMAMPFANVFPQVPAAAWAPYLDLYPAAGKETDYLTSAQVYALRSGGRTLLVDLGIGAGAGGRLDSELRDNGIDPAQVDTVIFTHLHIDHVGWAVRDGKAFFPRARYVTPRADYEFFRAPERAAEHPYVVALEALEKAGVLDLTDGEQKVTAELTLIPTPGHTPGHRSLVIASAGEVAYVLGDVMHHPAQLQEVAWSPGFDNDGKAAASTRDVMAQRLEREGNLFIACHFPIPGIGRVDRVEGRRVFRPL